MDDDWEEESTLVVELTGVIDKDFLTKDQQECRVLGIDTDKPLLQIGSYVFSGEYEDALGTCILFEENSDASSKKTSQPAPTPGPVKMSYLCHTRKKLKMQRAFLNEKKAAGPESEEEASNSESSSETKGEGTDESPYTVGSSWPIGFDSGIDLTEATEPTKKTRFGKGEQT